MHTIKLNAEKNERRHYQSINQSIKPLTVNDQWLTINIKIG